MKGPEDSGLTLPLGAAGAAGLAVEGKPRPWVVRAEPPRHPLAFLSGRCPTGPTDAALEGSELPIKEAVQVAGGRYLPVRSPLRDGWGGGKHKKELDGPSQPELSS